jgi:uncharacterized protein (TIGR03085 family)
MAPIDATERASLCDLFVELGPDAPTLCEGWTTADLASHLVLREHGHRWGDERRAAEKAKGYELEVARVRAGPPLPLRVPGIRILVNGLEFFIHHEDVRRANGRPPRPPTPELERLCWTTSGFLGRRVAREMRPSSLELRSTDGRSRRFGSGEAAILVGRPCELALYLAGRRQAAEVSIEGAEVAKDALKRSTTSL